eukprot:scaffold128306_cov46-Phaeocystis_antarctica.AAC.1
MLVPSAPRLAWMSSAAMRLGVAPSPRKRRRDCGMAPSAYRVTGSADHPAASLSNIPGIHGPCSIRSYQKLRSSIAASSPSVCITCTAHTASSAEWNPRFEPRPCGQKGSSSASPTAKTGIAWSMPPCERAIFSFHSASFCVFAPTKPRCVSALICSSCNAFSYA